MAETASTKATILIELLVSFLGRDQRNCVGIFVYWQGIYKDRKERRWELTNWLNQIISYVVVIMSYVALSGAALLRVTRLYSQSQVAAQPIVSSFHWLGLQRCHPLPIQSIS